LFYQLVVKGTLDHGWLLDNSSLGAPEGLNLRDVPTSDHNFYFLLLRLIGFLTADYALVLNLFFALSFPLTVISSLAVWRHFGLSWLPAILGSLLYTFLPFHFMRGQHHLFLSAYYVVPLTVLVVLWVCSEKLWREGQEQGWLRTNLRDHKFIISLLICVLVASTGTYYAFFACFLLLVCHAAPKGRPQPAAPQLIDCSNHRRPDGQSAAEPDSYLPARVGAGCPPSSGRSRGLWLEDRPASDAAHRAPHRFAGGVEE
jgi:phosphoglycerol transferase